MFGMNVLCMKEEEREKVHFPVFYPYNRGFLPIEKWKLQEFFVGK